MKVSVHSNLVLKCNDKSFQAFLRNLEGPLDLKHRYQIDQYTPHGTEARLYLSRQLYEEALHVQFYLTLLDTYIPDHGERAKAFSAIDNIPSIKRKAEFCFKWMDSVNKLDRIESLEDRRRFLMNLICFATCIEGLFFFGAFAYVYYLRSKGLLDGLASGTNWVFRDESCHINFALEVVHTARKEDPRIFTGMNDLVTLMLEEAVDCEMAFAEDVLSEGIAGLNMKDMRSYLEFVADQRLESLSIPKRFGSKNPFSFMELQDVQELTNFFERKVSAYQVGIPGEVAFDENF